MRLSPYQIEEVVRRALDEDVGSGDITTDSVVPESAFASATIFAKEEGIIAGEDVAKIAFRMIDRRIIFSPVVNDGELVEKGQTVATVEGPAQAILTGERVALNFLEHLSGIATKTHHFTEMIKYYNAKLTDTRKTTPGLRFLEKYAIRVGGGYNHRRGLYDAVLIKENHIRLAGGLKKAVVLARENIPHTMRIEVEINDMEQVEEALAAKVDILMLENMPPDLIKKVVQVVDGRAIIEASGHVCGEKIIEVAKTGIDYISLGCLTDSTEPLGMSLKIGEIKPGQKEENVADASREKENDE